MSKKKLSLILFIIAFVTLVAFFTVTSHTNIQSTEDTDNANNQPTNDANTTPKGPLLVVPENPLGTIGSIAAAASGFSLFVFFKKRK